MCPWQSSQLNRVSFNPQVPALSLTLAEKATLSCSVLLVVTGVPSILSCREGKGRSGWYIRTQAEVMLLGDDVTSGNITLEVGFWIAIQYTSMDRKKSDTRGVWRIINSWRDRRLCEGLSIFWRHACIVHFERQCESRWISKYSTVLVGGLFVQYDSKLLYV